MDIDYPPEAESFRQEIKAFLSETLPADWSGPGALPPGERDELRHQWRKILSDRGLAAVSWPRQYGGGGPGHPRRNLQRPLGPPHAQLDAHALEFGLQPGRRPGAAQLSRYLEEWS